jgi:predicted nucleic acid-binding protein
MGMTAAEAAKELTDVQDFFQLLPYTPEVVRAWQRIVIAQGVSGKQTHGAHLVAIMQVNNVASILTFNGSHFTRFPGITILNPAQV